MTEVEADRNEYSAWTVPEAEGFLGVSRQTLYRYLKSGAVRGFKLPGGGWRIPSAEMDRLTEPLQRAD